MSRYEEIHNPPPPPSHLFLLFPFLLASMMIQQNVTDTSASRPTTHNAHEFMNPPPSTWIFFLKAALRCVCFRCAAGVEEVSSRPLDQACMDQACHSSKDTQGITAHPLQTTKEAKQATLHLRDTPVQAQWERRGHQDTQQIMYNSNFRILDNQARSQVLR